MVANRDQLARGAPSQLRRPHGIRQVDSAHAQDSGDVAAEAQSDDIDSGEVTEVMLYAAVFLGFLLAAAVAAAVVFGLRALRHW
jgi:hypothetical protein